MNAGHRRRTVAYAAVLLCLAFLAAAHAAGPAADPLRPDWFVAEPAPNDNGTHVGLRWARSERLPKGFVHSSYVLHVARDPLGPWAACADTTVDAASPLDPTIAPYYPYHFSRGDQCILVVEPLPHVTVYWLEAERKYAGWVEQAAGSLRECERQMGVLGDQTRARAAFRKELAGYATKWRSRLVPVAADYLKRYAPGTMADQFDCEEEYARLIQREKELRARGGAELADVRARIGALRPAVPYARSLREAAIKAGKFDTAIRQARQGCLESAATFACVMAMLRAETKLQAADALGVAPDRVTADLLASRMPELLRRTEEAVAEGAGRDAGVAQWDAYDRLSYVVQLARHFVDVERKGVPEGAAEADLLARLAEAAGAARPAEAAPQPAPAPDTAALAEAMARYREAGLAVGERGRLTPGTSWAQAQQAHGEAVGAWPASDEALAAAQAAWISARAARLGEVLFGGGLARPGASDLRNEITRAGVVSEAAQKRLQDVVRRHAERRFSLRLGVQTAGAEPQEPFGDVASAAPRPAIVDRAKAVNFGFAVFFTCAVLAMMVYVRRHPHVFLRRIAGLEAVDEAIGRATEMGRPALFVHGLTGVDDIAVLASLSLLGRLARKVADFDSDLLVVNNSPIVYAVSYEVVQEAYAEAGRPDAFKRDNIFIAASEQFPYVAAVAGIMRRRRPAANFFMGYFYAESLILAEVGASTGAIQIAATDSFSQLPFFITTCDYTLMGEELYAAGAYMSRNARMLATIKAQDIGKSVLMVALPVGTALSSLGLNWISVLFSAIEKGF